MSTKRYHSDSDSEEEQDFFSATSQKSNNKTSSSSSSSSSNLPSIAPRNHRQEKEAYRERKKNRVEMAIEKNRLKERKPVGGPSTTTTTTSNLNNNTNKSIGNGNENGNENETHGTFSTNNSFNSNTNNSFNSSSSSSSSNSNIQPKEGVKYTVSIAIPGAVLNIAQSAELRTYMAGQIARCLTLYSVDEIVIYDDGSGGKQASSSVTTTEGEFESASKTTHPSLFLARILQYLETPQYLRKLLFPKHHDLTFAGLLSPIESPHHPKIDDLVEFREGIVLNKPVKTRPHSNNNSNNSNNNNNSNNDNSDSDEDSGVTGSESKQASKRSAGSFVNVGMRQDAKIDVCLQPGTRVTVRFENWGPDFDSSTKKSNNTARKPYGKVVAPSLPRELRGLYWGYSVRLASCLADVFSGCPYNGTRKYDLAIGVSHDDESADSIDTVTSLPSFRNCLIVFGGLSGMRTVVESDEALAASTPRELFSVYVNTCPNQGTRSVRPEESLLISLACLRPFLVKSGKK